MRSILSRSGFMAQSSIFLVLSVLAAALNYALYPAIARVLGPANFGDFTTVLALSNQILGILLAFNLTSIYLVKNNAEEAALESAQSIQKVLIWLFVGLTIAVTVISPFINHGLKLSSPYSLIVLTVMLIVAVPAVMWTGYLQGHKKLGAVGIYSVSSSLFKFVLALAFAKIWGVNGGLLGVLVGTIGGIIVLYVFAGVKLPSISSVFVKLTKSDRVFLKSMRLYIIGSVIVVGIMSILQNIDILFAKSFFPPSEAGVYTGISIISNALYYVSFLMVWVLLPQVSPHDSARNKKLLLYAYSILAALGVVAITVAAFFGKNIITLLLGEKFAVQADLLVYASIFQMLLVSTTLYVYYLLVLRSSRALVLASCAFVFVVTFGFVFGTSLRELIISLDWALLCGIAFYCIISQVMRISHNAK
jgi:O-antigen/teichoic acid export membrane protein